MPMEGGTEAGEPVSRGTHHMQAEAVEQCRHFDRRKKLEADKINTKCQQIEGKGKHTRGDILTQE